jgi:hypothetical protein
MIAGLLAAAIGWEPSFGVLSLPAACAGAGIAAGANSRESAAILALSSAVALRWIAAVAAPRIGAGAAAAAWIFLSIYSAIFVWLGLRAARWITRTRPALFPAVAAEDREISPRRARAGRSPDRLRLRERPALRAKLGAVDRLRRQRLRHTP